MYPILFSLGRIHIYSHGVMILLGSLIGGSIIYLLAKQEKLRTNFLLDLFIYSLLGGIVGARILYLVLYFNQFTNWRDFFFIWQGGLVSYGGIAGGLVTAVLILRNRKEQIWKYLNFGIIGIMTGWAIGRIGCLLAGDSLGKISESFLAIWGRWPTQIFESIWCLIVAAICYWLLKNQRFNRDSGLVFLVGISLYAIGRFGIDFLRDEAIFFWAMKPGQFGSILVLGISLVVFYFLRLEKITRKESNASA